MDSFISDGVRINVEWFAASSPQDCDNSRRPAVLLLHGADGLTYARGYRTAAATLAASGISVAFVHYLDRTGDRRVTYARLRRDFPRWQTTVSDAVTWLGARFEVDPGRMGIVGISLGAALALAAAARDARVRAIVDYFGPWPEELAAVQPRLPPVLILHGERDPIVPVAHARAIEEACRRQGTPCEVTIYPDQGHGLTGLAQFDAAARTAAFLARHLG